jgi:hypothetical protein
MRLAAWLGLEVVLREGWVFVYRLGGVCCMRWDGMDAWSKPLG